MISSKIVLPASRYCQKAESPNRLAGCLIYHACFYSLLIFGLLQFSGGVFASEISAQANNDAQPNSAGAPAVWPSDADGDLPMAGIFYGNHQSGVGAQNAYIGVEGSRRFRAERSGEIESVRFQNRVLTNRNIEDRCDRLGSGSDWCNCQEAGLDAYTCGYTLGSSYHVGNGGTIVIEIRPDDGNGHPADTVLGKTQSFVPMDNQDTPYPNLLLGDPVMLNIGQIYHLVFTNLNPPQQCKLAREPVSSAASCPRDQGAIGLNGSRYINDPTTTGRRGPYRGDLSAATLTRQHVGSGWKEHPSAVSWYEVSYADGVRVGESYTALESMREAKRLVSGAKKVRQHFTVKDSTRRVDGIWLNFGHSKTASGAHVSVALLNDAGVLLAGGDIPSSEHCRERVNDQSIKLSHWCRDWGYVAFEDSVSLLEGSTYSVELATEQGGDFIVSAYEPLNYHGFKDRNHWSDSRAQYSDDAGKSWRQWTEKRAEERDLPLLFTIEGMPRQLR